MNAKAAEIVAQLKSGIVLRSLRKHQVGELITVDRLEGKRVYFTNGKCTEMRSMFHYEMV